MKKMHTIVKKFYHKMKMKTMLTSVKKFDHKIQTNKMLTRNTKICKLFVVQYVFVRSVTLHTFVSPNKQFLSQITVDGVQMRHEGVRPNMSEASLQTHRAAARERRRSRRYLSVSTATTQLMQVKKVEKKTYVGKQS